jgi:restriction system protein
MASLIDQWRRRPVRDVAAADSLNVGLTESVTIEVPTGPLNLQGQPPELVAYPDVLIQATVVVIGGQGAEGEVIVGVAVPWFEIIAQLERDPEFLMRVSWRKLEEIIAGAYEREGWPDVVLTPRSGDRGRDVIATRPGVGSIRIVDQVKHYKPGHLVKADEVRSVLGVLAADQNVSKGIITTTSGFAPGIEREPGLSAFMPYRLELKDGPRLREWLVRLKGSSAC